MLPHSDAVATAERLRQALLRELALQRSYMGPFSGGSTTLSPAAVEGPVVSLSSAGGGSATGPAAVAGPALDPLICSAAASCLIDEPTAENSPDPYPDLGLDPDRDPGQDLAPDLPGIDPDSDLGEDNSPVEGKERLLSLSNDPQLEDLLPLEREYDWKDPAGEGGCDFGAATAAGCAATP